MKRAEQVDFLGHAPSDQTRHACRTTPTGRDAPIHFRHSPAGAFGTNHEVARHGDFQPSADTVTINGSDGDLVKFLQRIGHVLVKAHPAHHVGGAAPGTGSHFGQVVAGAEVATGPGNDNDLETVAIAQVLHRGCEFLGQRDRECIGDRRAVQCQAGDLALVLKKQMLKNRHGCVGCLLGGCAHQFLLGFWVRFCRSRQ